MEHAQGVGHGGTRDTRRRASSKAHRVGRLAAALATVAALTLPPAVAPSRASLPLGAASTVAAVATTPPNGASAAAATTPPTGASATVAGDVPPRARLRVSPRKGTAPLTVTLDARRSRGRHHAELAFAWDFGDGAVIGGRTARDPDSSGPRVTHVYSAPGTYVAIVAVANATQVATATRTIVVAPPAPTAAPTAPVPPPTIDDGTLEGFGASTSGGAGGREIHVAEPTEEAVRAAFQAARAGGATVVFDVAAPIVVTSPLPYLDGAFVTIAGGGATLVGSGIPDDMPILEVSGHDVIVRDLRVRNGGDNLRAQGDGAYNVVFSHVSSTGAADDGISIGYGAHDVTVQWSFLAGNAHSIFVKYGATTNVSIHHTWMTKQWIRGPLISTAVRADMRNVIVEDWTMWGSRFEADASGNVVDSLFTLGPYAASIGGKPGSPLRLIQTGPVFTAGNVYAGMAETGPDGTASAPLDAAPVTTLPVAEMEPLVRARAGCLPRDDVDEEYVALREGWTVGKAAPLRLGTP